MRKRKLGKMSVRLTGAYTFIMVVMLTMMGLVIGYTYRVRYKADMEHTLIQLSDVAASRMDSWLYTMDNCAIELASDMSFLSTWRSYQYQSSSSDRKRLESTFLKIIRKNTDIRRISVFDSKGNYYTTGISDITVNKVAHRVEELLLDTYFDSEETRMLLSPGKDFWQSDTDTEVISEIHPFWDSEDNVIGYIEVEIKASFFVDDIEAAVHLDYPVQYMIIWGKDNEILCDNLPEKTGKKITEYMSLSKIHSSLQETKEECIAMALSDYYQCRILLIMDKSYISRQVLQLIRNVGIIALIIMTAGLILMLMYFNYQMKPIKKLAGYMEKLQLANLDEVLFLEAHDQETQILLDSWSDMRKRLKDNMEKMNRMKDLQINTIFSILQNEIQPHFLNNTLGAIACLCREGKNKEAIKACYDLSDILRYASKYTTDMLPVENEIKNLEAYLSIMKNRYRQRLQYDIRYEKEVLDILLPKLTIQPLVENAIKYSLTETETVCIDVYLYLLEEILIVEISDNGRGISDETIDVIQHRLKKYMDSDQFEEACHQISFGGMGLCGTLMRMQYFYGKRFTYEIIGHNNFGGAVIRLLINVDGY